MVNKNSKSKTKHRSLKTSIDQMKMPTFKMIKNKIIRGKKK